MNTEEEEYSDSQEEIETKEDRPPVMIQRKAAKRKRHSTTLKILREVGDNLKSSSTLVAVFSFISALLARGEK